MPYESILAVVMEGFSEVLGIPESHAGDDFFMLGGTSIQAVELAAYLSSALEVDMLPDFVLMYPSPKEMARELCVSNNESTPGSSISD